LEPDGAGGWRKRRGRCVDGYLDKRSADVAAVGAMADQVQELLDAERIARVAADRTLTVRELARL
jgi:hypothetical protein